MSAPELRRILGRREVLGLAFGAMVGWSWVVLSGEMIDRAGTLGSILAFMAGALVMLAVGLTYAELTPALSRAGGELTFTFAGLGPGAAFCCGWALLLAYLSVCAFEAVALPTVAGYLVPGFEVGYLYTLQGWDVRASWVALGMAGSLVIGAVNFFGIRPAAFLQWVASALLLLIGAAFFAGGNLGGSAANLDPLFTGWGGFFRVLIMTPFLFVGFDVIPQAAEEIKVPAPALGRLILFSIALALTWYALVQWTVGLSLDEAARRAGGLPTADAMAAAYGSPLAGKVLVIGGLLGILTSWNAFFVAGTRLIFAMSRARMLPEVFCRLHCRFGSPWAAVLALTAVSMPAPLLGRPALVWLVDAGSLATVSGYLLVAAAFLAIARKFPDLPRPFRVAHPFAVGRLALGATLLFLILYLPGSPSALLWPWEWGIVLMWVTLGVVASLLCRRGMTDEEAKLQRRRVLGEYDALLETAKTTRPPL